MEEIIERVLADNKHLIGKSRDEITSVAKINRMDLREWEVVYWIIILSKYTRGDAIKELPTEFELNNDLLGCDSDGFFARGEIMLSMMYEMSNRAADHIRNDISDKEAMILEDHLDIPINQFMESYNANIGR